jgi:hypothetical protein
MKKIINLFTLGVFLISNIMTPLTNFINAEENVTLEDGGDLSMVRDMENVGNDDEVIPQTTPEESGETSTESVETPNPDNSQSEENNIPDEQPLDLLRDTIDNISTHPNSDAEATQSPENNEQDGRENENSIENSENNIFELKNDEIVEIESKEIY